MDKGNARYQQVAVRVTAEMRRKIQDLAEDLGTSYAGMMRALMDYALHLPEAELRRILAEHQARRIASMVPSDFRDLVVERMAAGE